MARDWNQKLAKPLVIVGEPPRILATLRDAGMFLVEQVHAHGETSNLRSAMIQLEVAVDSCDPYDVAEATDEVEAVLRGDRLN